MKIVVFGGTGLIGGKLVKILRGKGHEVIAASPNAGVDAITGAGLGEALAGAKVVVDVMNSPSWEDAAVLTFFETSTRNVIAAESNAGVKHHVALSVVGTDRLQESGYFRAKLAQERLIAAARVPYTIVRATQFFEFIGGIAQASTEGSTVRLPSALMQPMSGDDVAAALADFALGEPRNRIEDIAGPEALGIDEVVRRFLAATHDPRRVVSDANAPYYGTRVAQRALVPNGAARLGPTRLDDWLASRESAGQPVAQARH